MAKGEKWYQNPVTWIVIVVLVVVVWIVWPSGPGEYDAFAECLRDSGAVMYGTEWCHVCKDQKELFGKSFDKVNYVDCDRQRDVCLLVGVSGYPTWIIGGESYSGVQSLERLADLSGCTLTRDVRD